MASALYLRIKIAPWAKAVLWLLCKSGLAILPIFGEERLLRFAEWVVTKGHRIEFTEKP